MFLVEVTHKSLITKPKITGVFLVEACIESFKDGDDSTVAEYTLNPTSLFKSWDFYNIYYNNAPLQYILMIQNKSVSYLFEAEILSSSITNPIGVMLLEDNLLRTSFSGFC
jgi:hypothetical protein